jgi:hypothetical protein
MTGNYRRRIERLEAALKRDAERLASGQAVGRPQGLTISFTVGRRRRGLRLQQTIAKEFCLTVPL